MRNYIQSQPSSTLQTLADELLICNFRYNTPPIVINLNK